MLIFEGKLALSAIAGEDCFCEGFPECVHDTLNRIRTTNLSKIDVFVSHKPPPKYPNFPYNGIVNIPTRPKYLIGRR